MIIILFFLQHFQNIYLHIYTKLLWPGLGQAKKLHGWINQQTSNLFTDVYLTLDKNNFPNMRDGGFAICLMDVA